MNKSVNYPDDIRQYDNNPRSPFYDDSAEDRLDNRVNELVNQILSVDGYREGVGALWNISDVTDRIYHSNDASTFDVILSSLYQADTEAKREAGHIFYTSLLEKHAKPIATDIAERELDAWED